MILNGLMAISDALWGTPMIVVLVSMGLYLSIRFHFYYNFRHIGFHFCNTFGKMFQRHGSGQGSVSGFAAACTAMANTIGVGNIGGVATPSFPVALVPSFGCGSQAVSACRRRPVKSSWASAFASSILNPWTNTCATGPLPCATPWAGGKGLSCWPLPVSPWGPGRAVSRRNLSSLMGQCL